MVDIEIISISEGKIDAFVEDSKDVRRISATQLENQLQESWKNLQRILSDYQNSKETFTIVYISIPFYICNESCLYLILNIFHLNTKLNH